MDSRLDVENATYRHFKTSRINLDVRLALPGLVAIENIVVTKDATEARGDVRIRTSGLPACEFAFPEIKGGCDPRVVLRIINPEWEKYLESFTFDPYSKVECRGSFFLDNEPRLRLEGKLDTAVCTYRGIELRDVQADWQVNGATTSWNVKQAGLYGGTAGVSGFFDATTRSGLVAVNAQAVNLPGLLQVFGLGTDSTREGKLTANCRLQVLKDWAGTPLQLNGNGYLRLSEGNIWAVPFFDQLGQLLKVSGLERISTLDADLDFRGERVVVPTLKTNGTIIALEGRGEYSWTTEALAFRVWGETLRKIPVLSFALKPMSWVFDAELTGTVKDHRWRLRNALDRVLSRDAVLSNGEQ